MDMSMIANDAHVVHFLASMITKRLRDSVSLYFLPLFILIVIFFVWF